MYVRYTIHYLCILTFVWSSIIFAEETGDNTSAVSGGNQIVVSPINILLDISDLASVNILALDEEGNPIEGHKLQIVPQDRQKISVIVDNPVTDESGYINFSILGKQEGDTVVTVTDGAISSQINVAIRDLLLYVLPYFYGDMQLSIINPSKD
ncbi:MAG: Ig-like domain-containing protein, partial [Planctomycetota bacterium]